MPATAQSALLRRYIEARLSARIPAALSPVPQQAPRLMSCGVPTVDELLGGGIPLGGITEFSGMPSSGRTSLAFAVLAEASEEGACAYIDVDDSADPRCMAAAGVKLSNLLWVRLPREAAAGRADAATPRTLPELDPRPLTGRYGHHPRTESRDMDVALANMVKKKAELRSRKSEGTPGHPNRKLSLADASAEQIRFDQFNARRADESDPIRRADHQAAAEARRHAQPLALVHSAPSPSDKPWTRLDNAVRAADQILQSGGFRVVVLDLAATPPEQALRIPPATWFRFRRAAQESDAVFLLLTQVPCARSSASCVLDCATESGAAGDTVLERLGYCAEVARQRQAFGRKAPGRVAAWEATPAWMRAAGS